jgi:tetratricopeptide (TPR) repeat protein
VEETKKEELPFDQIDEETPSEESTAVERLSFFQKIWRFLFGRKTKIQSISNQMEEEDDSIQYLHSNTVHILFGTDCRPANKKETGEQLTLLWEKMEERHSYFSHQYPKLTINIENREYTSYYERGILFLDYGLTQRGLDDLDSAIENIFSQENLPRKEMELFLEKIYFRRGTEFLIRRELPLARKDFSKVLELNPRHLDAFLERGVTLYHLKQFLLAIRDFENVVRLNPNKAIAFYHKGACYQAMNNHQLAIMDFSRSLQIDPNLESAYFRRGVVYASSLLVSNISRFEMSIKDFTKAIELNPRNIGAFYERGKAYMELGMTNQAINDFTTVIQYNPKSKNAYLYRGMIYQKLLSPEMAIKDFNSLVEYNPDYHIGYYRRGITKFGINDLEGAYVDISKAIQLNSKILDYVLIRACILFEMNRLDESMKDFEFILDEEPSNKSAYMGRAHVLCRMGDYNETIHSYLQAIHSNPTSKQIFAFIRAGICTYVATSKMEELQVFYNCERCKIEVCESCKDCHLGHSKLIPYLGYGYCKCGETGECNHGKIHKRIMEEPDITAATQMQQHYRKLFQI